MTEHVFPNDIANGLVDGTFPGADVPASVQGAAAVLRAAHQAATEDELLGMAALMQRFAAEVVESSPATIHRSFPMFNARIPRRVAAIVAVTLLAAGTAAASAGGAFSSSSPSPTEHVVLRDDSPTNEGSTTSTTEAPADEPTTTEAAEEPTTAAPTQAPTTKAADSAGVHEDSHLYGKCTAFTHGSAKDLANPSFSELQVQAGSVGGSVDVYCAGVINAHKAAHAADDVSADDAADVNADDVAEVDADDAADVTADDGKADDGKADDVKADDPAGTADQVHAGDKGSGHAENGTAHSDGGHGHSNGG